MRVHIYEKDAADTEELGKRYPRQMEFARAMADIITLYNEKVRENAGIEAVFTAAQNFEEIVQKAEKAGFRFSCAKDWVTEDVVAFKCGRICAAYDKAAKEWRFAEEG